MRFFPVRKSFPYWRLYRVQFAGPCLGWRAIGDMIEANRHKLLPAFLFAFAVGMFHYWSDLRRADPRAKTHSQS